MTGRRRGKAPGPPGPLRALVTDVDGTVTDERRRLDPEAILALRDLEARGIPVVIATGNVLPISLALHRFLGLSGPVVAENGGILYTSSGGRDRVRRFAHRGPALEGYRRLRDAGVPARRLFTDRWRLSEVALEPTVPLATVRRVLRDAPLTVESTGYAIHLMERGAGKLPTLVEALRGIGLAPADCLVAGDGDNDVAMLRAAGFSVSFPNASPAARRAARYVTRLPFARGFVEALKEAHMVSPSLRGD